MKIKDLLKITGISLIGVLGVGLSIFGSAKGMTLLADNYSQASAYYVNENQNSVTFTKEELNNCTYPYISYSLLQEYEDEYSTYYLIYNNNRYDFYYDSPSLNIEMAFIRENDSAKYFSFDDEGRWYKNDGAFEYSITVYGSYFAENMQKNVTLSASQLNNNTYEYFSENVDDEELTNSYIIYNNLVYTYSSNTSDFGSYLQWVDSNDYVIQFNQDTNNWQYNDGLVSFNNSITIYSTYIADNLYAPNQPINLLQAIVSLLTGGIVGLSGGIGSGVSTLTTQIFISNNALSVFGGMIVVFAAISLAIGLCRWIMQFLTSLGAKK